jgi:hypothetical protein
MINTMPAVLAARNQQVYILLALAAGLALLAGLGVKAFPPRYRPWGVVAVTIIVAASEIALFVL